MEHSFYYTHTLYLPTVSLKKNCKTQIVETKLDNIFYSHRIRSARSAVTQRNDYRKTSKTISQAEYTTTDRRKNFSKRKRPQFG